MEKYLAKLPIEREKIQKYMEVISKYSFALGLFIELTIVLLDKSEYIIQYEGQWFRITFLLFGLSIVTTKRDLKQWIWFVVFAVIGFISYRATGRNEILRWAAFVWACYGKDMKKAMKYTFWYTALGCGIIIFLSVMGIYGKIALETIYRADLNGVNAVLENRFCFGMGHPNALHCMILVITWIGIYCYHEKIKWYGYILIMIIHIITYLFTDSRTGLLMSIGSVVIFGVLQYVKCLQNSKWTYIGGMAVVAGCVVLSVLFAVYCTEIPLFDKLNNVLNGRIFALMDSNRYEGMIHTWTLWSAPINNFYFDLGIVRFFYWFGIIPGMIYYFLQCRVLWCGYKNKDYMLLAMIVVITVYSVFEAHFISDYIGRNYIFFFFGMYLADMVGDGRKNLNIKKN